MELQEAEKQALLSSTIPKKKRVQNPQTHPDHRWLLHRSRIERRGATEAARLHSGDQSALISLGLLPLLHS